MKKVPCWFENQEALYKISLFSFHYLKDKVFGVCAQRNIFADAYSIENVVFHWHKRDPVILMNADKNDEQETPQFYFYKQIHTGSCEKTTSFGPSKLFFTATNSWVYCQSRIDTW